MTVMRPICVLIGALGGQGGGVLAEWLVEAAHSEGYPAQATSTPGVAQRTGATTYYFELFPEKKPAGDPIFTLFPGTGDLDIMAALEPTEAGRSLEKGYITQFSTVITGLDRIFSTSEKMAAGDGTIKEKPMLDSVEKAVKRLIRLDVEKLVGSSSARVNSVLFGAIIGTGILPLSDEVGRISIRNKGVSVDANLKGYEAGLNAARAAASPSPLVEENKIYQVPHSSVDVSLLEWPQELHQTLNHAVAKLVDYQDTEYVDLYFKRLKPVLALDNNLERKLTNEVAKRLAVWMCFEDVMRVAQLKTRTGRLSNIRKELGVSQKIPLRVTDYFKPGREEIIGMLPKRLGWIIPKLSILERGRGLALHIPTGTFMGFAILKLLAAFRVFRRGSAQYSDEQVNISTWLEAIKVAAQEDYDLAYRTAKLSIWARGYGQVRKSGQDVLDKIFEDWSKKLTEGIERLSVEVDKSLVLARANPDAIDNA